MLQLIFSMVQVQHCAIDGDFLLTKDEMQHIKQTWKTWENVI